jgi:hypothetical protein
MHLYAPQSAVTFTGTSDFYGWIVGKSITFKGTTNLHYDESLHDTTPFTASLVQLQPLMSVQPAIGLLFFAAVVVLTMLAVESFDARLIWDPASAREVHHA